MIGADQLVFSFRRDIAFRLPTLRRHADGECAEHHQHEVKQSQHNKSRRDTDRNVVGKRIHQRYGQRRGKHRTAAEPHNRQTRRHARFVGKPLHQSGHRPDIAQSQADATDHAVAQIEEKQIMRTDAECRHKKAQAETARRNKHRLARSDTLHPSPK